MIMYVILSLTGRRPYMEDVDFVFQTVRVSDKLNVSVFGVLDGHGGRECAQFVGDELPMKIAGILRSGATCPIGLHQSLIDIDKDVKIIFIFVLIILIIV